MKLLFIQLLEEIDSTENNKSSSSRARLKNEKRAEKFVEFNSVRI